MTIKFNKTELFAEAKAKLSAVLSNPESTEAEQTSAYQNYLEVMQNEIVKAVSSQVNNEMLDRSILQQRGQNVLTSEETKAWRISLIDVATLSSVNLPSPFKDLKAPSNFSFRLSNMLCF